VDETCIVHWFVILYEMYFGLFYATRFVGPIKNSFFVGSHLIDAKSIMAIFASMICSYYCLIFFDFDHAMKVVVVHVNK